MTTGEPDPSSRSFPAPRIDLSEYETSVKRPPLEVFMGGLGLLGAADTIKEMNAIEEVIAGNMYGIGDASYLGKVETPGMLIEPIPTLRRARSAVAFRMFVTAKDRGVFDDLQEVRPALETYRVFQAQLEPEAFVKGRHITELQRSAKQQLTVSRQRYPYPYSAVEYRSAARRDIRLAREFGLKRRSALVRNAVISLSSVVPTIRSKFAR